MYTDKEKLELDNLFEGLLAKIREQSPSFDEPRVRVAYDLALEAHAEQRRKDGSPYVTHPIAAAEIIVEMGLDTDSIIAALLHDSIEDTQVTYDDVKAKFGEDVADLVDGVTKLTRVQYSSKEDEQMENLRKMFLAMARDIRVILIKIADRLHNMRTIAYHNEQKRREKALETMEIYAPLAHRLGIQKIKWELEDLALQCLDPIGYKEITDELAERERHHAHFLDNMQELIAERLSENNIEANISGRVKHVYSIYRKMMGQHKAMYEIYDLYAVRVIVEDIVDCYNVLGIIHDLFKPIPGRFKDYISMTKPNLYQSLHTTVIGREGMPFEVQIRTWEMHKTAEYGIAAHWKYKDGVKNDIEFEKKLEWVRRLLEVQQDADADEFIRGLKIDMFSDEVFVYTPKGDVINLPAGATPIDFAYAIHSEVGNRMTGAKVSGRIVGLDYKLENGDIVDVITSKASHGPSRDWIDLAKTSEAKNKIKQWFKRERREENIAEGRQKFEEHLKKLHIQPADLASEDVQKQILKRLSFGSLDELYAAIGYGGLSPMRAANRVKDELVRLGKMDKEKPEIQKKAPPQKKPTGGKSDIIVEGVGDCLIKLSRCCNPIPGDDIVGFITKGYGVSVHKTDCKNVGTLDEASGGGRWVDVHWAETVRDTYETEIEISAKTRPNIVVDVVTIINSLKVTVSSLTAKSLGDGYDVIHISLRIKDRKELENVMAKLARVSSVVRVARKSEA